MTRVTVLSDGGQYAISRDFNDLVGYRKTYLAKRFGKGTSSTRAVSAAKSSRLQPLRYACLCCGFFVHPLRALSFASPHAADCISTSNDRQVVETMYRRNNPPRASRPFHFSARCVVHRSIMLPFYSARFHIASRFCVSRLRFIRYNDCVARNPDALHLASRLPLVKVQSGPESKGHSRRGGL